MPDQPVRRDTSSDPSAPPERDPGAWAIAPGCVLLSCAGELDAATAPALAARLRERAEPAVIVDLTAVSFMDSTGLSILLNARLRYTRAERSLVVLCPDGPARRVLRLSGLEETLSVADSLGAAQETLARMGFDAG
ncbi:STAS domain-containing protein [Paraconexibacter antarcticus]|uniref:Anti-sigma factor antagonist n=1 Tax=Paraconexibacter antarcticus TaxID=2949664 RepID=A0ABY5DTM9_9ACTN|nr:STAS domain-containing protein [Paraconexibacter antarcticus]UTI65388.1 STAS domain-containing protein [Paraconexibacter antarcticus]